MRGRILLIGALGTALVVGAGASAFAASSGSTSGAFSFVTDLASHLGISTSTLNSALKATAVDRVNALVKAGKITSAQAQKLETQIQSGTMRFGDFRGHRGGPGEFMGGRGRIGQFKTIATYLGISQQTLMQDLRAGQTLSQIVTSQGKTTAGLETALQAALQTQLNTLVAGGRMTTAQEQKMLSGFSQNFQNMLTRTFKMHGGMPPETPPGTTTTPGTGA